MSKEVEPEVAAQEYSLVHQKQRMLRDHLISRGIRDRRTLEAMAAVPRERFVAQGDADQAYVDHALQIGFEQTISQPYIVALMTQLAAVGPGERVLEVGTGSGYQTAVLAALGAEVFSVEIVPELAQSARERLADLGYRAALREGDGYFGWPEHAPYQAIVVTAAPPSVPPELLSQLAVGGRLVLPVGDHEQTLCVIRKTESGTELTREAAVRFVPMVPGNAARRSAQVGFLER